jgi:hypothetical protein
MVNAVFCLLCGCVNVGSVYENSVRFVYIATAHLTSDIQCRLYPTPTILHWTHICWSNMELVKTDKNTAALVELCMLSLVGIWIKLHFQKQYYVTGVSVVILVVFTHPYLIYSFPQFVLTMHTQVCMHLSVLQYCHNWRTLFHLLIVWVCEWWLCIWVLRTLCVYFNYTLHTRYTVPLTSHIHNRALNTCLLSRCGAGKTKQNTRASVELCMLLSLAGYWMKLYFQICTT